MSGKSKITVNHTEIMSWAEAHGGRPMVRKFPGGQGKSCDLCICIPGNGYNGAQSWEEVSWEVFFRKFDNKNLAFLYRPEAESGQKSSLCKLVSRW